MKSLTLNYSHITSHTFVKPHLPISLNITDKSETVKDIPNSVEPSHIIVEEL